MAFKIYTKTGDKGETSLFGGKRLPKDHLRIESYGTVDELNAFVGLIRDVAEEERVQSVLEAVQNRLFTIGSSLASDPDKNMMTPDIEAADISLLEEEMDRMDEALPALKHFVLPGGHLHVSYCHLARTVCRRAERRVIALSHSETVDSLVIQYLNRASDYFFVLGRYFAHLLEVEEIKWVPRKKG